MSSNPSAGQPQGVRPPPPGVVADFQHRQSQTANIIAFQVIMLFFVTTAVAIRLYTRIRISCNIGIDDFLCIAAYLMICTDAGLYLAMVGKGLLGFHIWEVTPTQFVAGYKVGLGVMSLYFPIAAIIKLSCLAFYRRTFRPNRIIRYLCSIGMVFIAVAYTAFFVLSVCACIPIAKNWDPSLPGYCFPNGAIAYGSGALNVITDIFVVALPMPVLWGLKLTLSRRLKVMAVFGLGLVVVALSITRLAVTPLVFTQYDLSWNQTEFSYYVCLELDIGIICSCLLTFPSFLDRYIPLLKNKIRSYATMTNLGKWSAAHTEKAGSNSTTNINRPREYRGPYQDKTTMIPQTRWRDDGDNSTVASTAAKNRMALPSGHDFEGDIESDVEGDKWRGDRSFSALCPHDQIGTRSPSGEISRC